MESNNYICGKHIKGEYNFIPDVLSFEGSVRVQGKGGFSRKQNNLTFDNPPNDVLTNRILSQYPQTAPARFCISHLDTETFSWALQTAQLLGSCWNLEQNPPTKGATASGEDGPVSVSDNVLDCRPFLSEYQQETASFCSKVSSKCSEQEDSKLAASFEASVKNRWSKRLSELPEGLYWRRLNVISGGVPCTVRPTKTNSSLRSNFNLEPSKTPTHQSNSRERSHQNSSGP